MKKRTKAKTDAENAVAPASDSALAAPYCPTPQEGRAVEKLNTQRSRVPPPRVHVSMQGRTLTLRPDHTDQEAWSALVANAFGTPNKAFADLLIGECVQVGSNGKPESVEAETINSILAAVRGIEPRDEAEAMLAVQMVAAHRVGMECFRRASLDGQSFEARAMNLNQANKLSRTYAALMETLNRNRGKGQQHVEVRHVHVADGGKAFIGSVSHPALTTPPGAPENSEVRAHAQAANAPFAPLPSEEPERSPLPSAEG